MYAGADEYKDQRRDDRIGNADFRLQPLGILGIALVDALKKLLAVLYIFRVCVYLIHQPILLAVLPCRPIRDLHHKPDNILRVGGCLLHELVLDLFHTVGCGLNYQIVKIIKIQIEISGGTSARPCQCLHAGSGQSVFGIAFKAFLHPFRLFCVVLFLSQSCHSYFLLYNNEHSFILTLYHSREQKAIENYLFRAEKQRRYN